MNLSIYDMLNSSGQTNNKINKFNSHNNYRFYQFIYLFKICVSHVLYLWLL